MQEIVDRWRSSYKSVKGKDFNKAWRTDATIGYAQANGKLKKLIQANAGQIAVAVGFDFLRSQHSIELAIVYTV